MGKDQWAREFRAAALRLAPRSPDTDIAPDTDTDEFAVLFAKAEVEIDAAVKRKKNAKPDAKLLNKFAGRYPPSLLRIMAGDGIAENTGFHKIALQVVITSHALGKNEEQMLAACEGLMLSHVSDGQN